MDTSTHPFCENGHIWTKETRFSTVWEGTDTGNYRVTFLWPCRVYGCRSSPYGDALMGVQGGWKRATRYCGHLYSPLLRKWTYLDQRDQVFYCMGEDRYLWPCRVYGCRSFPMGCTRGLKRASFSPDGFGGTNGALMGIRRGWKGGFEITRFLSRSLCSGASLTPLPWRGALWRGLGGIDTVTGVERGLERRSFARLFSRPLWWLTGLSHVELLSPAKWEA